ncbi:MAG: hypothetical protein J7L82_01845 [Staphylothermus sp.]|nr:hypothetical protein [Staphylothermus sp.]
MNNCKRELLTVAGFIATMDHHFSVRPSWTSPATMYIRFFKEFVKFGVV